MSGHVLHGVWRPGAPAPLALWAEELVHRRLWEAGEHPAAVPGRVLRDLLDACGPALRWLAAGAEPQEAVLHLPTRGGRPVPSPDLLGPSAPAPAVATRPAPATLAPWTVEALAFPPGLAAQLLGELADPYPWTAMLVAQRPAHDPYRDVELRFGPGVRWLVAVHDLAWRTVRRGGVLPLLARGPGGAVQARWRAVPGRAAATEFHELAAATPPAVLSGPPGHRADPVRLVVDAVDLLADAEVRLALQEAPEAVAGLLRPGDPARTTRARVTRAWVAALASPSGQVLAPDADGPELDDLAARLRRWHRSAPPSATGLVVGFRLEEPEGADPADPMGWNTDEHWRVALTVRPAAEPALLVDVERVWAGGAALAALQRTVPKAEEALLDELDRAVRCWPPLAPALRDGRPDGVDLDRSAALAFLRDGAPALADAGFEVRLPAWWRGSSRLGLHATALGTPRTADPGTVRTGSVLDRDTIVDVRWEAALDGVRLTREELERLAEAALPLVRVRGRWLLADRDQITAALAFLGRLDSGGLDSGGLGSATVAELLRAELAAAPTRDGLPVDGISAPGALGDLLAGRAPTGALTLPAGFDDAFRARLRPYQHAGVAWLTACERLGLGAVLADDMGLGKTVQTLALLVLDRLTAAGAPRPTLLVCPTTLVDTWRHEAARWAPDLRVHAHHGPGRHGSDLTGHDLVVTTFAVAQRDVERLGAVAWHRLVVDEAHQLANRAAGQSRAVRSLPARHRIALTGTPVQNRLADLHAVLDLVNPGLLGSAADFKERYAVPIERHARETAVAELRRRTRPLLLRRVKTDPAVIADLPEKVERTEHCPLTVEQAVLYRAVVADLLHRLSGPRRGPGRTWRRGAVLASLAKLKQVCDHPALLQRDGSPLEGRSGKVSRLEDVLDDVLASGEKALCFTQFATFGTLLQPYLARRLGRTVLLLHGGVPRAERDRLVQRFEGDDDAAVFLLSLRAGGAGLTLTAASHVVHLDRWWNPAVEDQATDRAHRIGQRRDVQVRRLVCAGTIEERIDDVLADKRALADAVVPTVTSGVLAGEAGLADLPDDALARLLALATEPTGPDDPAEADA